MAAQTEKITLGTGTLIVNSVDVGHLKGDVEFAYTIERVEFKPSAMLGVVKVFKIREDAQIRATVAELKMSNLKLAMGSTTTIGASQSFPEEVEGSNSCQYSVPNASYSFDVLTFGGDKSTDEFCLRFTHERPDGKKFHIILYRAVAIGEFTLPFHEDDINLYDIAFKGLADEDRTAGDQIGVLVEEVQN